MNNPSPPGRDRGHLKQALRATLRAKRDGLSASARAGADEAIAARVLGLAAIERAERVFCYLALEHEVQTKPLVDAWVAAGKVVAVPKIVSGSQMRACGFESWAELRPGPLGILAPQHHLEVTDLDVVIVPGLGFTLRGARLGYGGGYYDRWLAANPDCYAIGLAYETQLVAALPTDPTDVNVQAVVSEARLINCET